MIPALKDMLDAYQPKTPADYQNAAREIVQEIALLGFWRGGFFEHAAFYGGTALRIFHGLRRFSEDLDFTLTVCGPQDPTEPDTPRSKDAPVRPLGRWCNHPVCTGGSAPREIRRSRFQAGGRRRPVIPARSKGTPTLVARVLRRPGRSTGPVRIALPPQRGETSQPRALPWAGLFGPVGVGRANHEVGAESDSREASFPARRNSIRRVARGI
jgi:hypothetical protein